MFTSYGCQLWLNVCGAAPLAAILEVTSHSLLITLQVSSCSHQSIKIALVRVINYFQVVKSNGQFSVIILL